MITWEIILFKVSSILEMPFVFYIINWVKKDDSCRIQKSSFTKITFFLFYYTFLGAVQISVDFFNLLGQDLF